MMTNFRFLLLFILSLSFTQAINAQNRGCATVEHQKHLQAKFPNQIATEAAFEQWMSNKKAAMKANRVMAGEITIPVVVHIIHNGDAIGVDENLSEAQILSQIQVLNEDFGKMMGSRGFNNHPDGADTKIEWCMAKIDPDGNPTDGINRVQYAAADWETEVFDATVKPATQWDPTQYCNVWVANLAGGTLGYAQFPEGSGLQGMPATEVANTDGVVMTADAFGTADADDGTFNLNPTYNLGRTMTHEVGHWLGLRHIWGDGNCTADDFVADTPNAGAANYACVTTVSCGSTDMIENYMDYTNDACMNIFTQGQKDRIDVVLANSPRRMELSTSNKCTPLTEISFYESKRDVTETTVGNDGCLGYEDIDVLLRISNDPSADATVDLSIAGTAIQGEDFDIMTPMSLTFLADQNMSFTVTLRIYDDSNIEPAENIVLGYTITTAGDAVGGGYNQTFTVTIIDNEVNPFIFPTEILSEDFETGLGSFTTTTSGPNAFATGPTAAAASQYYVIETSNNTNFAYINDDNCNCDLSDVKLISPVFSLVGASNSKMTFDHAFANTNIGETFDVLVSTDGGATWLASIQSITNNSTHQGNGVYSAPWTNGTMVDLSAYDGMANLKIAFQYNDNSEWAYGTAVDNVTILTDVLASIQDTLNTVAPQTEYLGPNATVNFYDPNNGNIMMTIENLSSHNFGCTSVSINRAGTGAVQAWNTEANTGIASKTFDVNPEFNSATGTYNITLYYTAAEVNGWANATGQAISDLVMIKTEGDITAPANADVRESIALTNNAFGDNYALSATFATGFSDFGIGPDAALPVELLSFGGSLTRDGIQLEWKTLSEINSDYFELQHSTNGIDFEYLTTVKAAGNTNQAQAYQFLDRNYNLGNNYYRLKMVDQDETYNYSKTVVVKADENKISQMELFPNPASAQTTLSLINTKQETVQVRVHNAQGQKVVDRQETLTTGANAIKFNLTSYQAGLYFIDITDEEGIRHTFKLVKR